MNRRSRIALVLAAGLVACAQSTPSAASGAASAVDAPKKCKKRVAQRSRRCNRRRPATLTVSPPGNDFGTIGNADSGAIEFAVTNSGGRPSGIPATSLSGTGAHYFRINGTTCAGPLAPRATCVVTVQSVGNDGGTGTAQLNVSATPGGTASATLVVNLY